MLPIHTILHPTDFSERSRFALRLAGALARDYGARLILLHVAVPPVVVYGEGAILPTPEEERDQLLAELEQLQVPGVHVEHRLEEGDPVAEIVRVAEESRADLIVMGTHGRTGFGRLLMGSVAERTLRKAPCPVLTVRAPFPRSAPVEEVLAEPAHA